MRCEPPKITLEYDPGIGYLLQANLQWNGQRQKGKMKEMVRVFLGTMESCGAVDLLGEDELKALGLGGADRGRGGESGESGESGGASAAGEKMGSGDGSKSAYVVPARKEPSS